jgi:hypothetical protein
MRQQQQQHPSRACRAVVQALREAFLRTDADLAGTEVGEVVGTTAVTAVLSQSELFIGHAGECRMGNCCAGACASMQGSRMAKQNKAPCLGWWQLGVLKQLHRCMCQCTAGAALHAVISCVAMHPHPAHVSHLTVPPLLSCFRPQVTRAQCYAARAWPYPSLRITSLGAQTRW